MSIVLCLHQNIHELKLLQPIMWQFLVSGHVIMRSHVAWRNTQYALHCRVVMTYLVNYNWQCCSCWSTYSFVSKMTCNVLMGRQVLLTHSLTRPTAQWTLASGLGLGTFAYSNLSYAKQRRAECTTSWIARRR